MEQEERNILAKSLLEDCDVKDVVDYFGAEELIEAMDQRDVANCLDYWILNLVDDDELINAVDSTHSLISALSFEDIVGHLEDSGYVVIDDDEDDFCHSINKICRTLHPNGYIGKEEAKKIICDFIDTNYTDKSID